MGNESGFLGTLNYLAKEASKMERTIEQTRKRRESDLQRRQRNSERSKKLAQKEEKQRYLEERINEVNDLNEDIVEKTISFNNIINTTLQKDDTINLESLKDYAVFFPFDPPYEFKKNEVPPNKDNYLNKVLKPSGLSKLFKSVEEKYKNELLLAEEKFKVDYNYFLERQEQKKNELEKLKNEYEEKKNIFEEQIEGKNKEVDKLVESLKQGKEDGVITYFSMVLERSEYPDDFPQNFDIEFNEKENALIIDYELPSHEVVPASIEFSYNKAKDSIIDKKRKNTDIKEMYDLIISSICIRTIHEIFESDQFDTIKTVFFNGYVEANDRATGKAIKPYLVSTKTYKKDFLEINLSKVEPLACLNNLNSRLSSDTISLKNIVLIE